MLFVIASVRAGEILSFGTSIDLLPVSFANHELALYRTERSCHMNISTHILISLHLASGLRCADDAFVML